MRGVDSGRFTAAAPATPSAVARPALMGRVRAADAAAVVLFGRDCACLSGADVASCKADLSGPGDKDLGILAPESAARPVAWEVVLLAAGGGAEAVVLRGEAGAGFVASDVQGDKVRCLCPAEPCEFEFDCWEELFCCWAAAASLRGMDSGVKGLRPAVHST